MDSDEKGRRVNQMAAELSQKIFSVLPSPTHDLGEDEAEEVWQALLMALGITIGSLMAKSPFSPSDQLLYWNLISQYALLEVILPEHKEKEKRQERLEEFLDGDWEPEGEAH